MTQTGSILGTEVRRVEDPELIRGHGTFVDNIEVEGKTHAIFVRSPFAHARITAIDTGEAESAPGVIGVFTSEHLGTEPLKSFADVNEKAGRAALAVEKVRYVGDPVALVVAETRAQAMDAAELVDVDYDDLPAVSDVEAALADDAPLQFEEIGSNVATQRADKKGEDVLEGAAHVTRVRMVNQRIATAPIEGHAILVDPTAEPLTVWISTQHPHMARDLLAETAGVEKDELRVIAPHVGGAFGGKAGSTTEHAAVLLAAQRLGRPVVWSETRSEAMLSMHGRGQVQYAEVGFDQDARITGLRLRVIGECGAYAGFGGALAVGPSYLMATGPYAVPKLRFDAVGVMTNTSPVGAFRGAGRPEAAAALERVMDVAAAELGLAPEELRRRNLIPKDAFPYSTLTGMTYDSGDYLLPLEQALEIAGVDQLRKEQQERRANHDPKQLGIGIATYVEITGFGGSELGSVQVQPDGSAVVMSGTSAHGQGHATSFSMIASDKLGIPLDKITYRQSDTALVKTGGGTGGSRSLQIGGSAVAKAADELREKAIEIAARMLEAAPDDVTLEGGTFGVAGVPDSSLDWTEVAAYAHEHEGGLGVDTEFTLPGRDVPVRRARVGGRGRHRHRTRGAAATRRRRRLRHRAEPPHRARPAARRCGPGHQPGPVGGDGLRRRRDAADRDLRGVHDADRRRHDRAGGQQHRDPVPPQPARRQGHRRVRDDRFDPGGAERRRRRALPPRCPPHRPAVHSGARVAGHPGRCGRQHLAGAAERLRPPGERRRRARHRGGLSPNLGLPGARLR